MGDGDRFDGFGERAKTPFLVSSDARVDFYRLALAAYDYRCALTGTRFDAQGGLLLDQLHVVFIQPRELGGPLDIGNLLVFTPAAGNAFRNGAFTLDDDGRILLPGKSADLQWLGVENAAGQTLFLPADPLFRPAARFLQFHRLVIAIYDQP